MEVGSQPCFARAAISADIYARLQTGEFIEVLGQRGFAGDRGRSKVKALCKTYQSICEAEELRKSRDRSKHKLVSREERVLGGLRRFCKSYRDSFDLEEELVALALVFKEDLNFTRKLIMLLKNLSSIPDDLVLVSLKALRVLLEDNDLSEAGRVAMQVFSFISPFVYLFLLLCSLSFSSAHTDTHPLSSLPLVLPLFHLKTNTDDARTN